MKTKEKWEHKMSQDEVRLLLIWGWFKVIFQHWRLELFLSMSSGARWGNAYLCAGSGIASAFFLTMLSNLFKLWPTLSYLISFPLLNDSFYLFKVCLDTLARQWSAEETHRMNKLLKTFYLCRFTLCYNKWRKMKLLLRKGWKLE